MPNEFAAAVRVLRMRPGFSAAVVATLAIAIGASAGVFGVVDRLIIRPLPFADHEQIVFVEKSWPLFTDGVNGEAPAIPDDPFTGIARYEFGRVSLSGGTTPRVIKVARVTRGYFPILATAPAAGRFPSDAAGEGNARVVVLSNALNRSVFAGDSAALGRALTLNGRSYTVIGVMPADFSFYVRGETVEAWVPFVEDDGLIKAAQEAGSGTIARLKSDLTIPQASAKVQVALNRVAQRHPNYRIDDDDRIRLVPLRDHWFGSLRFPLLMLLGASGCLLIIACANATGLMLARAAATRKATAIRAALGADRGQLIRETLAESLLLGLIATAAGLLLAHWGARAMIAVSPARIPHADEIGVGIRMVGFAILVALPAAGLSGLVSAWRISRGDLAGVLGAGGRQGVFISPRMRRSLVAAQVAITVTLLVNAGLLLRSFQALRGESTGFDARSVLTMEIAPLDTRFPDAPSRLAYYQRLLENVRSLPSVAHVGLVNYLPLHSGSLMIPVTVPERPASGESFSWTYRSATPEYFQAMRIPVLAGRAFSDRDRIGAPSVAILDRSAAQLFVGRGNSPESAIGKRIAVELGQPTTLEIVGIVGDIRQQGLGIESYPGFYVSAYQRPPSVGNLVARTAGDAATATNELRRALQRIDADLPVGTLRALDARVSDTVSRRRFAVLLIGVLGVAALILSVLGLAGLMAQLVAHRTHEIGVRVALGARPGNVLELVLRQGVGMVTIGVVAGLAGALASARLLSGLLYGIGSTDPATFVAVPLLMVGVAALACTIPARRALGTSPIIALRGE